MNTSIKSPNMRITEALRAAAGQKLNAVMSRLSPRIAHVTVTLTDENGPAGGMDKRCRVNVFVPGLGSVTTEGTHEDALAAIDRALRRARRVILKRFNRRVTRSRQQPAHASSA